mgnify:CR=1 FL=1
MAGIELFLRVTFETDLTIVITVFNVATVWVEYQLSFVYINLLSSAVTL